MKLLMGVSLMTRNPMDITGLSRLVGSLISKLFMITLPSVTFIDDVTGEWVEVCATSGIGVTSIFTMESSPSDQLVVPYFKTQEGGKAGVWEGDKGLVTDGCRLFLATGHFENSAVYANKPSQKDLTLVDMSFIESRFK
ncbi:hypothetical protein BOTNAR_0728g00030 [Botryotinia narcissicola]|uniref:Uncharacterized protein n=1 Tax=Botryotinia narcissicola TaxID=278944 RepID=A0A4Z1H7T3_9HELO|nr:hypothetical protein BOTNAR_0728g00030 [Botryotinia narcissicola]